MTNTKKYIGYKYFNAEVKKEILLGSVQLCSLEYFRNLEKPEIGDPGEGTRVIKLDNSNVSRGVNFRIDIQDNNTGKFIPIGGVQHMQIILKKNCLIYSMTRYLNNKKFCEKFGYDSVVKICDAEELARRISEQLASKHNLQSVKTYLGTVMYGPNEAEKNPPELVKKCDFKWQEELRILFYTDCDVQDKIHVCIDPSGIIAALD